MNISQAIRLYRLSKTAKTEYEIVKSDIGKELNINNWFDLSEYYRTAMAIICDEFINKL